MSWRFYRGRCTIVLFSSCTVTSPGGAMTQIIQKGVALGLCCVLVALAMSGCVPFEQQVSEHPGTAVGTVTGAAGGALLGGLIFQSTTGAVIGGLVGGLTGGLIGNASEAKKQDQEATNSEYGYRTNQG